MKKRTFSLLLAAVYLSLLAATLSAQYQPYLNYAEALQKSLYFYDAEKSGPGITGGKLQWRGDSEVADQWIPLTPDMTGMSASFIAANQSALDPDGNGTLDLSMGYHDAGDHVKFGLPQHYALSTLGWGFYEFKQSFIDIGEEAHMLDLLKWGTDYLLNSTFRNSAGDVVAFCFQVGDGDVDHTYWGPPELQQPEKFKRPARFATSENPASDQVAGASAALAVMALNYGYVDAGYAARCLDNARALYEFAKAHRGLGNSGGYYGSGYDYDELSWAATWLYVNTGDYGYIDDINHVDGINYTGYMSRIIATTANTWQNIWVHCWDVVWGGVFVVLSRLFPDDAQFDYFATWNIEYWSGGVVPHVNPSDTAYLAQTPAGYGMINTWGSARYNTAAQMCALVYHKYKPRPDFLNWAESQMVYILGDNPMEKSYLVGYGPVHAEHPHHRAAHGSKTNSMDDPPQHRHMLWGALVGGPDGNDVHVDSTTDYVYNEVAIDYNAGAVGALAAYYQFIGKAAGHTPVADFPLPEPPSVEYYAEGKLEQENTERTQITLKIHNESIHPPRFASNIKCRYFFDVSELVEAGQSIADVELQIMYDEQDSGYEGPTLVTGPHPWDVGNNIYYAEFDWSGYEVYGDRDLHFALVAALAPNYNSYWDHTNDFSRQTLAEEVYTMSEYIPVYLGDTLVYGSEPPIGSTPVPTDPGSTPVPTPEPQPDLKAQYRAGAPDVSSNQLTPQFIILNTGRGSVDLKDVTLRYYYTKDGSEQEEYAVDYAQVGAANLDITFGDGFLQVGFKSGAGVLAGSGSSGAIHLRINKTGYTMYNQANDYSFNAAYTAFADYNKVTVYINGQLVWGIPVDGPQPTPTPTPTQIPPSCLLLGDVNGSGTVDIVDALMTAQYYVGLNPAGYGTGCGDVNCDGMINIVDALIIAQYYVGLRPAPSC